MNLISVSKARVMLSALVEILHALMRWRLITALLSAGNLSLGVQGFTNVNPRMQIAGLFHRGQFPGVFELAWPRIQPDWVSTHTQQLTVYVLPV